MAEYIDKELVIDTIEELKSKALPKALLFDHLKKVIEVFPTEDFVPVKHGHWEYDKHFRFAECSECEAEFYICDLEEISGDGFINFCPNCGAKMDGGDNS